MRRLNWLSARGLSGYFSQDFFRHATLVRGIVVGGGPINTKGAGLIGPPPRGVGVDK